MNFIDYFHLCLLLYIKKALGENLSTTTTIHNICCNALKPKEGLVKFGGECLTIM